MHKGFSRFLLILATIELLTWPLTQHLWTWDHFLHGGQDFESCLLVAVISLCLVLLLAQHSKHLSDRLLAILRPIRFIAPDLELSASNLNRSLLILLSKLPASCFLSLDSFPFQI